MLKTLSRPLVRLAERWLPSALTFAVILTAIVALLALTMTDSGPVDVVRAWGDGLIGLLAFMTQMSLILLLLLLIGGVVALPFVLLARRRTTSQGTSPAEIVTLPPRAGVPP